MSRFNESHSAGGLDPAHRGMAWKAQYAEQFVRRVKYPQAELAGMRREGAQGVWIATFWVDDASERQVEVVCGGSMMLQDPIGLA